MAQNQPTHSSSGNSLGSCPACNCGQILNGQSNYHCDSCDFKLWAHCLSHLGKPVISPDEMKAMLSMQYPWLSGMVNNAGNIYGGYACLRLWNGRWSVRFYWNSPPQKDPGPAYQPVRTKRVQNIKVT